MYKSIFIRGFRCFTALRLDRLARVNLIAGKNGSGKTALLEAIWLNRGYHNPELALSIDGFRGITQFRFDEFMWTLFRGYRPGKEIVIETTDLQDFSRTLEIYLREPTEYERKFIVGPVIDTATGPSSGIQPSFFTAGEALFKSMDSRGNETAATANLEATPEGQSIRFTKAQRDPLEPSGIFLSSLRRSAPKELAERLSQLTAEKQEESIVQILRIIDSRITRIAVEFTGGEPGIRADIGEDRMFPLPLLGDGLYRLLTIALSIPTAQNGEVMIDEVENGLHYSVLPGVWRAISTLAEQYNVQIFATTHSQECIRAAVEAFSKGPQGPATEDHFLLHRLETIRGETTATTYGLSDLAEALDSGLEIR